MRHIENMYFSKTLLTDLLDFGVSKGAVKEELSQLIGISNSDDIKYGEQISYEQMIHALNSTGQMINDENLGLHMGEALMLKGTEYVDNIMRNSPSIEEAFRNAVNYSKLISDALNSKMEKKKDSTRIFFEVNPNWSVLQTDAVQQIIDLTLVCTFKSIYWLTKRRYAPTVIHLNYQSKKHRSEYYRIFDCAIKFNEESPGIIFRNPVLDQAVPSHNTGLLSSLKEEADSILSKLKTESLIITQIKELILKNLPLKTTLDAAALALHLSPRTLQRNLSQLDTTFKKTEKEILLTLSKKLIVHEGHNLEEVAYLLGFSESSALVRFFKKEMGITPKRYKSMIQNT